MKKTGLIICSAIKGRLLDHGEPVAGAKIMRQLDWNMVKEPIKSFTTTDEEGNFEFPEEQRSAKFGFLARAFHVPCVGIAVYLLEGDVLTLFYAQTRLSYEPAQETGYDSIEFTSDLENKKKVDDHFYNTTPIFFRDKRK